MKEEDLQEIRQIVMEQISLDIGSRGESLIKMMDSFREEIKILKIDLNKTVSSMFENADFVKSFKSSLTRFVQQEISVNLSEQNINILIKKKLRERIKEDLKDIISSVVREVINKTNKKLTQEYEIAKELSYSINAEIKQTLIRAPISANQSDIIKKKIMNLLENTPIITQKANTLLENKE